MVEQLIDLIKEYQTRVFEAVLLFEKYKGISRDKLMYARHNGLSNDGFLDPKKSIEYYFHGIGCRVTFPNRSIDWDFGYDGRFDGFDAWRLWIFAEEGTKNFPDFREKEILNLVFNDAKNKEVIHKKFKELRDDLYYLKAK